MVWEIGASLKQSIGHVHISLTAVGRAGEYWVLRVVKRSPTGLVHRTLNRVSRSVPEAVDSLW